MRFAWLLVLGLAATPGCSGCVEDKPGSDKPAERGPIGEKRQRLIRPIITVDGDGGGAAPTPPPQVPSVDGAR